MRCEFRCSPCPPGAKARPSSGRGLGALALPLPPGASPQASADDSVGSTLTPSGATPERGGLSATPPAPASLKRPAELKAIEPVTPDVEMLILDALEMCKRVFERRLSHSSPRKPSPAHLLAALAKQKPAPPVARPLQAQRQNPCCSHECCLSAAGAAPLAGRAARSTVFSVGMSKSTYPQGKYSEPPHICCGVRSARSPLNCPGLVGNLQRHCGFYGSCRNPYLCTTGTWPPRPSSVTSSFPQATRFTLP